MSRVLFFPPTINGETEWISPKEDIMFQSLSELLGAYQKRDPAARSKLEIFLLYPGVHAVIFHRVSHWTAEIGDDCLIYHGVTLGGTGKDHGKRHPTIGNNVLISCGAKVLGPFRVGDNARIASNAVVLSEVPEDATAVGIPAQIVRIAGRVTHYADDVDQTSVENPTLERLEALSQRVEFLEKLLDDQFLKERA